MPKKTTSGPLFVKVWTSLMGSALLAALGTARAWLPKLLVCSGAAAVGVGLFWLGHMLLPWIGSWVADRPQVALIDTRLVTPKQWEVFLRGANLQCMEKGLSQAGADGLAPLDPDCERSMRAHAIHLFNLQDLYQSSPSYSSPRVDPGDYMKAQSPEEQEAGLDEKLARLLARRLRQGESVETAAALALKDFQLEVRRDALAERQRLERRKKAIAEMRERHSKIDQELRAHVEQRRQAAAAAYAVGNALQGKRVVEIDRRLLRQAMEPVALSMKDWPTTAQGAVAQSPEVVSQMRKSGFWALLSALVVLAIAAALYPVVKKGAGKVKQAAQARREMLFLDWEAQQLGQDAKAGRPQKTRARL